MLGVGAVSNAFGFRFAGVGGWLVGISILGGALSFADTSSAASALRSQQSQGALAERSGGSPKTVAGSSKARAPGGTVAQRKSNGAREAGRRAAGVTENQGRKGFVATPPIRQPGKKRASRAASPAPWTVLFDEVPAAGAVALPSGAERYLGIYQDAADPGARSGTINAPRVVAHVRSALRSQPDARWGMLDFEFPYDEILARGPSDHRHAAAVASLVATIRAVKREFPQVRWTYYGFPRLPYWIGSKDWGMLAPDERDAEFAKVHASFGGILDELDWVQPSVYDKYEDALGMPQSGSHRSVAEVEYRRACVEVSRNWYRAGRPAPPVIPAVSPWFQPGGRATVFRAIPTEEFEREQIRPLVEAGASGVSIWGAMNYYLKIVTVDPAPTSAYAREWRPIARDAFAREHFANATSAEVSWSSALVRDRLAAAFRATFTDGVRTSVRAGGGGRVATGSER
jgi:hypothetical protein